PTPTPTPTPTLTPTPTPTPPSIVGAVPVISQKKNKKGHPVGKATLAGYRIDYSTAMNQAAIGNSAEYQVGMFVIKKVRKKKVTMLEPIGFTVTSTTSVSATLTLAGKQKFTKGGQITVIASGIDNTSGVFLAANGVFTISPGGKGSTLVS